MMNKKKPIDARLTDRVYSGETIVGGKKKMHWTEDGWKEGEKKQNTNPFRIKKVGDKYEYDFVSYDEWEKIMEKYDYEGDIDGFELWLHNWNKDNDWETFMDCDESKKMIKLKELINPKETKLDSEIESSIDELGDLTKQIDRLKKQLQPLQKKYGSIVENLFPIIDKLDKQTITTNNFVMRIIRKGYERETYQYKVGFENGLSKVNENVKRVLLSILEETKKLTKINPSLSVKPIGEGTMDKLKLWYKRFKMLVKKLSKNFKGISDGNKKLKRLV